MPATCQAPESEQRQLTDAMATAPASVGAMFLERVAATPDREAFRRPDGAGGWASLTWAETAEAVREIAAGLLALGVQAQDPVAIASGTRLEWVLADLGVMCAGAATTTVYPTSTPEDVEHILRDSGSRLVFAEDVQQLAKLREHWAALPALKHVVLIDGQPPADDRVLTLETLRDNGRGYLSEHPAAVEDAVAAVQPEHLATLVYTSGTTGRPKGVRLPHSCWVYTGIAIDATGIMSMDDLQYLWLPLSHVFGKVLLTGQLRIGFPTAVDGDLDRLVDNLAVVRPTVMAGAPRIYEKVHSKVVSGAQTDGGLKLKIFTWALGVGRRVSELRLAGESPRGLLAVQHAIADRLVFSKLRNRFGGRVRYFISGAAPLSREIGEWFHAAGVVILEGYGLTETSAASFVNRPGHYGFGTVGLPLAGTEVRLDDDGEVLLRGPGVMEGYHGRPEETAEVLTPDGWFRTGDIGEIGPDGGLRITDRKKDLIKTSGGKYIAPQAIETRFKAVCPYVSQIVVHGDGRNFVSALVTLDPDAIAGWAAENDLAGRPYAQVVGSPQCRQMVADYIEELNATLGRWETIKKFEVLTSDFTVEDGDLTPSMKLRRRTVEGKFASVLDGFYDS
jgi:long-chain acyl-CoA synthetase